MPGNSITRRHASTTSTTTCFSTSASAIGRGVCGGTLEQLGEDVSEQLEIVPARFKVILHVRPRLVCTCCDCVV
ncbi:IS66 family transposase zinc-finger binding domain-containing protein [Jeongeupia naejangsanensis]